MPREDNITLMMNVAGNFKGIAALLRNREISQEEAANLRAYAFKRIGIKVGEIRNEIVKLQAVVQTLETICLHGSQPKLAAAEGDVARLREAVKQLHGWTVSLAESDYELLSGVEDPSEAWSKFNNLAGELMKLRMDRQVSRQDVPGKGRISV